MSSTQRTTSRWMRLVTASLTRGGAHHGRPLRQHLGEGHPVDAQPAVQLVERQVDQAVVQVVGHHLREQPAEQGRDGLLAEARDQRRADEVLDVVVAHLAQAEDGDLGDLVDDAAYVRGIVQPLADPQRDGRGRDPLADDPLLEEVLADELLQPAPELVLALRDQRRVRDRDAERVLEERRDGEPVGDRADHRRLGAGVDEARASRPGPGSRRRPPRRTRAGRPPPSASGAGRAAAPRRRPGRA